MLLLLQDAKLSELISSMPGSSRWAELAADVELPTADYAGQRSIPFQTTGFDGLSGLESWTAGGKPAYRTRLLALA